MSDPLQDEDNEHIVRFLGMPMRWEAQNMFRNVWNPDDDRLFPPKYFGIGWDLNLHALAKKTGLLDRT